MDGLLLDTEQVYFKMFLEAANDTSFPHPERLTAIFHRMVGMRAKDSREIMQREIGSFVDVARFDDKWRDRIVQALAEDIPLKAGVVELLEQLREQGLPCAVATSTRTSHALENLEKAGIRQFFSTVIGGEQVSKGKPSPEIYLRAAAAIEVDAINCAAFEDSNTGIKAAVASGAVAVQIPDMVAPTKEVISLGHVIATDLLGAAKEIGLLK